MCYSGTCTVHVSLFQTLSRLYPCASAPWGDLIEHRTREGRMCTCWYIHYRRDIVRRPRCRCRMRMHLVCLCCADECADMRPRLCMCCAHTRTLCYCNRTYICCTYIYSSGAAAAPPFNGTRPPLRLCDRGTCAAIQQGSSSKMMWCGSARVFRSCCDCCCRELAPCAEFMCVCERVQMCGPLCWNNVACSGLVYATLCVVVLSMHNIETERGCINIDLRA